MPRPGPSAARRARLGRVHRQGKARRRPLIDIGVHILDLTLFFNGLPKPLVASGKTWTTLARTRPWFNSLGRLRPEEVHGRRTSPWE